MNQEQFDADNKNESPAELCSRRDWWHDFRGNPVRKHFDQIGRSWHRSQVENDTPAAFNNQP